MGLDFKWSINVSDSVFTVFPARDSGASKFFNKLYVLFPIIVKKMAVCFFSSVTPFATKYCLTLSIYSVTFPFSNQTNKFYPVKPFFINNLSLTFQTFIFIAM